MTVLNPFTPAEVLVLTQGSSVTLRQLLKVTFLDLVLKQALQTKLPTYELDAQGTNAAEKYVVPGSRFFGYPARPHEDVLLAVFHDYPNTSLLFKYAVELAYQKARSKGRFLAAICNSPVMEGLVYRNFFNRLFGTITITQAGKEKAAALKRQLHETETQLADLVRNDRPAALELLALLGGAVLLLQHTDLAAMDGIDRELLAMVQQQKRPADGGSGCSSGGCSGCGSWDSVNDYNNSWDSGCGSSDGNSSGCGGDSGCSSGGDSGCSGCGGGCGGGD